jgi:hypothetical protein
MRELFEALLRRPADLARHIACGERLTIAMFGTIALIAIAVFGLILGTFAYGDQLWAAPTKLAGGLVFAALMCFPSLYIFSNLAGAQISAAKLAGFLGGMLALAGLLLLGFAPALWIFTQATMSFGFMGFLALGAWLLALMFAFRFLLVALRAAGASQIPPLFVWFGIFVLVTLQLSTSLRPILGHSDKFFTTQKKFFLHHWAEMYGKELPPIIETTKNAAH